MRRRRPRQSDKVIIPSIGREGCVVEVYVNGLGGLGYEVEIFDSEGDSIGLQTFTESEIYAVTGGK